MRYDTHVLCGSHSLGTVWNKGATYSAVFVNGEPPCSIFSSLISVFLSLQTFWWVQWCPVRKRTLSASIPWAVHSQPRRWLASPTLNSRSLTFFVHFIFSRRSLNEYSSVGRHPYCDHTLISLFLSRTNGTELVIQKTHTQTQTEFFLTQTRYFRQSSVSGDQLRRPFDFLTWQNDPGATFHYSFDSKLLLQWQSSGYLCNVFLIVSISLSLAPSCPSFCTFF